MTAVPAVQFKPALPVPRVVPAPPPRPAIAVCQRMEAPAPKLEAPAPKLEAKADSKSNAAPAIGGLVPQRTEGYLKRVGVIAGLIGKIDVNKVIALLYEAAQKELLPELSECFPKLKTDLSNFVDEATFSRSEWSMTIALSNPKKIDLKHLSASVLHETRHVEQAWADACKLSQPRDGFRSLSGPQIAGKVGIPQEAYKSLPKHCPQGIAYVPVSKAQQSEHNKTMSTLEQLRAKQFLGMTSKEEDAQVEEGMTRYKLFPREADAFRVEEAYAKEYDQRFKS